MRDLYLPGRHTADHIKHWKLSWSVAQGNRSKSKNKQMGPNQTHKLLHSERSCRQNDNQFSSVQLLSRVWLFSTPWTAACQASLSITNSRSPPKCMSIKSMMKSNHLILCRPLLLLPSIFPASGSFPMSQLFASGGQSTGVSAPTSVFPMNTQDWSPLGLTALISCSPRYSQESSLTPQFKSINSTYWMQAMQLTRT